MGARSCENDLMLDPLLVSLFYNFISVHIEFFSSFPRFSFSFSRATHYFTGSFAL